MSLNNFLSGIKTVSGATSSELTVLGLLLFGFTFGLIVQSFHKEDGSLSKINPQVFRILDSLAELSKEKYTGTDQFNNAVITEHISETTVNQIVEIPEKENSSTIEEKNVKAATSETTKKQTKADKIAGMKINLNTASKVELMKLPNVGEKTAIAIIEYRSIRPFTKTSDIKNVKNIGEKKFEAMREFIEVK